MIYHPLRRSMVEMGHFLLARGCKSVNILGVVAFHFSSAISLHSVIDNRFTMLRNQNLSHNSFI